MKFITCKILIAEVPDEISLGFEISGCKIKCPGCHSPDLWNASNGTELTNELFESLLTKYGKSISCVVFLGGEWYENELIEKLKITRDVFRLKTCLYTGEENVSDNIRQHLDYLKTGPFKLDLGGLNSSSTNQRMINVHTGECLNHKFAKI